MDKVFIISAGHGGIIDGRYVTAPKKMYDHGGYEGVAYEGQLNRQVITKIMTRARLYGYKIINITDTELDIDLDLKCAIVNEIANEYGKDNCLAIDFHSNAGGGTGFEIYTSIGDTPADPAAALFGKIFQDKFPHIKYRFDFSTGSMEMDKERPFYFLKHTICPAILPEWMFFDNINDWRYMKNPDAQTSYADMVCEFFRQFNQVE